MKDGKDGAAEEIGKVVQRRAKSCKGGQKRVTKEPNGETEEVRRGRVKSCKVVQRRVNLS